MSKQAVLQLWGSAANAPHAMLLAVDRFGLLCREFVDADKERNEARMSELVEQMREVVSTVGTFQRAQFRKWAKEREAQRR